MLNKNRNKTIFLILASLAIISCQNKEKKEQINTQKIFALSKACYEKSVLTVSLPEYNKIYKNANDSLSYWTKNKLSAYKINQIYGWHLDSLL